MSPLPDIHQRIEALLRTDRLVLFMDGAFEAPECAASLDACHALARSGLAYAQIDVRPDPALREGIATYGGLHAIPQLYVDGKLVGSGDAIGRMADAGELHVALGLTPDRTPPSVRLTPAAAEFLRNVIANTGGDPVAEVEIDAQFCSCVRILPRRRDAIVTEVLGVPLQFGLASARRADGLSIDWDDSDIDRGGWSFANPNAPLSKPVRAISPVEADARVRGGTLTIVDVRAAQERALARLPVPFLYMDDGTHEIRNLDPDAPLACLCHRGDRSRYAAEHFWQQGHRDVYYIEDGIEAWADSVDASIPRY